MIVLNLWQLEFTRCTHFIHNTTAAVLKNLMGEEKEKKSKKRDRKNKSEHILEVILWRDVDA